MYFGRDNIAATIHVPFACGQRCGFCTIKEMYEKYTPSVYGVLHAIEKINKLTIPEVVISGGEPFADLDFLDYVVTRLNKKIYINTCMPDSVSFEDIEKFLDNHTIRGINISRHDGIGGTDAMLNNIADDNFIKNLSEIAIVRINCVLSSANGASPEGVIERWKDLDVEIAFRADYRTITPETLHTLEGAPAVLFTSPFMGESHCDVCQTFRFKIDDKEIIYHKGLKQTRQGEQINDIIVYPDGQIALDWGAEPVTDSEMTELLKVGKKVEKPKAKSGAVIGGGAMSPATPKGAVPPMQSRVTSGLSCSGASSVHCGSSGC